MTKIKITLTDKKRYALKIKRDEQILLTCKGLEKKKLSPTDQATVKLIKTQLKDDWRGPLVTKLNGLTKKYR